MSENYSTVSEDLWNIAERMQSAPKDTVLYEYVPFENSGADVTGAPSYQLWTTDANSKWYLPGTFIEVRFKIQKAGPANLTLADHTALASNGWCLFEDLKVSANEQQIAFCTNLGKLSHVRNLIESSPQYLRTVGEQAHYFLDEVSDLGNVATVAYSPPLVGDNTSVGESPVSFYHESRYTRALVNGGTNASVTSMRQNPTFDRAMKRKIDRILERENVDDKGFQTLFLPVRDVAPVFNLDKIITGTKIKLELRKATVAAEAIFGATQGCSIVINKVVMWMPRLRGSLAAEAAFKSQVDAHPIVKHAYENAIMYKYPYSTLGQGLQRMNLVSRQSRPTKVIIGFQWMQRDTDERLNPLKFDRLLANDANALSSVTLYANGTPVPMYPYEPDSQYVRIIQDLYRLDKADTDKTGSTCISYENWAKMYPLFGFDLSKLEGQPYESVSTVELILEWRTKSAITNAGISSPANYNVVAMIYSEAAIHLDYSKGVTLIQTE